MAAKELEERLAAAQEAADRPTYEGEGAGEGNETQTMGAGDVGRVEDIL